jgi:hypothetical protein
MIGVVQSHPYEELYSTSRTRKLVICGTVVSFLEHGIPRLRYNQT